MKYKNNHLRFFNDALSLFLDWDLDFFPLLSLLLFLFLFYRDALPSESDELSDDYDELDDESLFKSIASLTYFIPLFSFYFTNSIFFISYNSLILSLLYIPTL